MRSLLQISVLLLSAVQCTAIFGFEKTPASANLPSVFGVSRGGGLFGGSKEPTQAPAVEEK